MRVLAGGRFVVVCWEHECLVAWLHRFAGIVNVRTSETGHLPCGWEHGRFDILWLIERSPSEDVSYNFVACDQALLPDDEGVDSAKGSHPSAPTPF
jgi:hypothetical protein